MMHTYRFINGHVYEYSQEDEDTEDVFHNAALIRPAAGQAIVKALELAAQEGTFCVQGITATWNAGCQEWDIEREGHRYRASTPGRAMRLMMSDAGFRIPFGAPPLTTSIYEDVN
jgi:hypothetical protein